MGNRDAAEIAKEILDLDLLACDEELKTKYALKPFLFRELLEGAGTAYALPDHSRRALEAEDPQAPQLKIDAKRPQYDNLLTALNKTLKGEDLSSLEREAITRSAALVGILADEPIYFYNQHLKEMGQTNLVQGRTKTRIREVVDALLIKIFDDEKGLGDGGNQRRIVECLLEEDNLRQRAIPLFEELAKARGITFNSPELGQG